MKGKTIRKNSSRGMSTIVTILLLSAVAATTMTAFLSLSNIQLHNYQRRAGLQGGWEENSFALELSNELIFKGVLVGFTTPGGSTYWVGAVSNSKTPAGKPLSWSITNGYPVSASQSPVGSITVYPCNVSAMTIKDLSQTFSSNPTAPKNCPVTKLELTISDAQNAKFVEFLANPAP